MVLCSTPYSYPNGQQTFLGATISNFSQSVGYDDSPSTLNVELVIDEFNKGDQTPKNSGQDLYHNGTGDSFAPPPVGSPVFFMYSPSGYPISTHFGQYNNKVFSFGGILQSFRNTNNATTGSRFSARVIDPRQILGSVNLVLQDFGSSTQAYNIDNLINIRGFLEHSLTGSLVGTTKHDFTGNTGSDMSYNGSLPGFYPAAVTFKDTWKPWFDNRYEDSLWYSIYPSYSFNTFIGGAPSYFPTTGPGYVRKTDGGVPFYRILQALNFWSGYYGSYNSGQTYSQFSKYFGRIYYRGHRYYVNYRDLPMIDPLYRFDTTNMSLLDFFLEVADVANCSLFFQLGTNMNISISSVKRTQTTPTNPTPVKDFIENIQSSCISTDVGYELTDIPTNKVLVGARKTNHYLFRDNKNECSPNYRWRLEGMLQQQIVPYFGLLPGGVVTIPKGFGDYKQILLDSSEVTANGVGDYYVATEMELRHAKLSFESWSDFLMKYNDRYLESCEGNDIRQNIEGAQTEANPAQRAIPIAKESNYRVTVPRCVWGHYYDDNDGFHNQPYTGFNGDCSPGYGYPLYYNRATAIGLPQAGLASLTDKTVRLLNNIEKIKMSTNINEVRVVIKSILKEYVQDYKTYYGFTDLSTLEVNFIQVITNALNNNVPIAVLENINTEGILFLSKAKKIAKQGIENAKKVHAFLKNIADECLGKKFLIQIPQNSNKAWPKTSAGTPSLAEDHNLGPFGFYPDFNYTPVYNNYFITAMLSTTSILGDNCLKAGVNTHTDQIEYNFEPSTDGAYYAGEFGIGSVLGSDNLQANNYFPKDLSRFYESNGKISAFCRFNHSQYFSFHNIGPNSLSQQARQSYAGGPTYYPDIGLSLTNVNSSLRESYFDDNDVRQDGTPIDSLPDTIGFVKCSIDEKFYHTPATQILPKTVWSAVSQRIIIDKPSKIMIPFNDEDENVKCEEVDSVRFSRRHFIPSNGNSSVSGLSFVEGTGLNVYALITLAGAVEPLANTKKGMMSQPGILEYMHLLFRDAIPYAELPPGFDTLAGTTAVAYPPDLTSTNVRSDYIKVQNNLGGLNDIERKSIEGLNFASQKIEIASPSPISPDYVMVPLRSLTDNYGPWRSEVKYIDNDTDPPTSLDLGGKTEFIHDESIAPWNFNGYSLMNQYAKNLVNFTETPAIFTEQGSFTLPTVPDNTLYVGKQVGDGAAIISNISTTVDVDGVTSTYTLSTYTDQFGRVEKQKRDQIKKVSILSQKMRDQTNENIRRRVGKQQTSLSYNDLYSAINNNFPRYKVFSVTPKIEEKKYEREGSYSNEDVRTNDVSAIIHSDSSLQNVADSIVNFPEQYNFTHMNSAIVSIDQDDMPISLDHGHANMPSISDELMLNIDYQDGLEGITTNEYYI